LHAHTLLRFAARRAVHGCLCCSSYVTTRAFTVLRSGYVYRATCSLRLFARYYAHRAPLAHYCARCTPPAVTHPPHMVRHASLRTAGLLFTFLPFTVLAGRGCRVEFTVTIHLRCSPADHHVVTYYYHVTTHSWFVFCHIRSYTPHDARTCALFVFTVLLFTVSRFTRLRLPLHVTTPIPLHFLPYRLRCSYAPPFHLPFTHTLLVLVAFMYRLVRVYTARHLFPALRFHAHTCVPRSHTVTHAPVHAFGCAADFRSHCVFAPFWFAFTAFLLRSTVPRTRLFWVYVLRLRTAFAFSRITTLFCVHTTPPFVPGLRTVWFPAHVTVGSRYIPHSHLLITSYPATAFSRHCLSGCHTTRTVATWDRFHLPACLRPCLYRTVLPAGSHCSPHHVIHHAVYGSHTPLTLPVLRPATYRTALPGSAYALHAHLPAYHAVLRTATHSSAVRLLCIAVRSLPRYRAAWFAGSLRWLHTFYQFSSTRLRAVATGFRYMLPVLPSTCRTRSALHSAVHLRCYTYRFCLGYHTFYFTGCRALRTRARLRTHLHVHAFGIVYATVCTLLPAFPTCVPSRFTPHRGFTGYTRGLPVGRLYTFVARGFTPLVTVRSVHAAHAFTHTPHATTFGCGWLPAFPTTYLVTRLVTAGYYTTPFAVTWILRYVHRVADYAHTFWFTVYIHRLFSFPVPGSTRSWVLSTAACYLWFGSHAHTHLRSAYHVFSGSRFPRFTTRLRTVAFTHRSFSSRVGSRTRFGSRCRVCTLVRSVACALRCGSRILQFAYLYYVRTFTFAVLRCGLRSPRSPFVLHGSHTFTHCAYVWVRFAYTHVLRFGFYTTVTARLLPVPVRSGYSSPPAYTHTHYVLIYHGCVCAVGSAVRWIHHRRTRFTVYGFATLRYGLPTVAIYFYILPTFPFWFRSHARCRWTSFRTVASFRCSRLSRSPHFLPFLFYLPGLVLPAVPAGLHTFTVLPHTLVHTHTTGLGSDYHCGSVYTHCTPSLRCTLPTCVYYLRSCTPFARRAHVYRPPSGPTFPYYDGLVIGWIYGCRFCALRSLRGSVWVHVCTPAFRRFLARFAFTFTACSGLWVHGSVGYLHSVGYWVHCRYRFTRFAGCHNATRSLHYLRLWFPAVLPVLHYTGYTLLYASACRMRGCTHSSRTFTHAHTDTHWDTFLVWFRVLALHWVGLLVCSSAVTTPHCCPVGCFRLDSVLHYTAFYSPHGSVHVRFRAVTGLVLPPAVLPRLPFAFLLVRAYVHWFGSHTIFCCRFTRVYWFTTAHRLPVYGPPHTAHLARLRFCHAVAFLSLWLYHWLITFYTHRFAPRLFVYAFGCRSVYWVHGWFIHGSPRLYCLHVPRSTGWLGSGLHHHTLLPLPVRFTGLDFRCRLVYRRFTYTVCYVLRAFAVLCHTCVTPHHAFLRFATCVYAPVLRSHVPHARLPRAHSSTGYRLFCTARVPLHHWFYSRRTGYTFWFTVHAHSALHRFIFFLRLIRALPWLRLPDCRSFTYAYDSTTHVTPFHLVLPHLVTVPARLLRIAFACVTDFPPGLPGLHGLRLRFCTFYAHTTLRTHAHARSTVYWIFVCPTAQFGLPHYCTLLRGAVHHLVTHGSRGYRSWMVTFHTTVWTHTAGGLISATHALIPHHTTLLLRSGLLPLPPA